MPVSTFLHINYFAVLLCGSVYFALGILWYKPQLYFNKALNLSFMKENELRHPGVGILISFSSSFFAAFLIAYFITLTDARDFISGSWIGIVAALTVFSISLFTSLLFYDRRIKLQLVDAGYHLMGFMIMSLILTNWR